METTVDLHEELKIKLNPIVFPHISGKMWAIAGYILDAEYTDPAFSDMCITSDGHVMAQNEGDCGLNEYIGYEDNLKTNWANLLEAAELTDEETQYAQKLYNQKIRHF